MKKSIFLTTLLLTVFGAIASAQTTPATHTPTIDAGDTAWMIVATAFVLLMSIPGLALFYGGLVRRKNVLNVFMQVFIIVAVISIEWVAFGYSLSFGSSTGALAPYIGGFDWAFLNNINISDLSPYFISHSQIGADGNPTGTIPHIVFIMFQGMFAVITPALIIGAFAERINFKGFLVFTILWSVLIYNPIAHWVWSGDGWLFKLGALDFAGGTVVHINAGIAAIVTAIMLGKRRDYQGHAIPPHNITYVVMGAGLLWVGWFGFNAGSGLAADGLAGNALMVTHIAAAAAALTWALLDWILDKRPTVVGISTGAVGGLVAITPAAGFVGVPGAIIIGIAVSLLCFAMVAYVKPKLGYDDSLDAFGVHGMGGILGAILTGVLATPAIQSAYSGAAYGNFHQLWVQLIAIGATIVFSGIGTYILFKLTDLIIGVRATDKQEAIGLDESQHGETAYNNFD
ncbi:MAG TPA: ammonium transporter [Paludibacter sp.]|nr:ammonium transporter [Paludibacter sp.]